MVRVTKSSCFIGIAFALFLLSSAALKLYASRLLAWEVDYVPLLARGQAWLDGGAFPVVGTLSSVAAFNMPFLVWMQLPALLVISDVRLVLVGTQLSFNLLTTCLLYRLGSELFDRRAGWLAALLFAFSAIGISGAYTAWAQLQMPGFFALFAYCLFRWQRANRAWQAALTLITATAAFMTHFSAVLLFGVLAVLWIALGLSLNRRGLIAGFLISFMMLAPYLIYEASVEFIDFRAHFTRRNRVSAEVMAEYADLKPMGRAHNDAAAPTSRETAPAPPAPAATPRSTRLERGVAWLLSIPNQIVGSLRLAFSTDLLSLKQHQPGLYQAFPALRVLLEAFFWYSLFLALYRYARQWRAQFAARAMDQGRLEAGWRLAQNLMLKSADGRCLALMLLSLAFSAGLTLTRAAPDAQPSYYTGLVGIQFLICGYGMYSLASRKRLQALALALVLVYALLSAYDTIIRVSHHDRAAYSALNLHLYSSINDAASWIASDWQEQAAVTINYDMLPEMSQLWWVLPWHTVDPSYRFSMALDYLLKHYYDLENGNRNPLGITEDPDYILTSARGLARHDLEQFQVAQFGALYLLKPA